MYLFEDDDGDKMAHFRWFQHGAETALEEMASPCELFLLTQCDDGSLNCIYNKIKVTNRRNDDSDSLMALLNWISSTRKNISIVSITMKETRNSQMSRFTKLMTRLFDAAHHTVNAVRSSQQCLALSRHES